VDDKLQVDILGPLSVRFGGLAVDTLSPMPRDLLGLLAVQHRQVVSVTDIVDVLWGDRPPRTCSGLVHGYIAQVRRTLEPDRQQDGGGLTVAYSKGGYRVELEGDQLDLARFDSLVASAERARVAGSAEVAHTLLHRALRCWNGAVLADARARLRQHPAVVAAGQRRLAATLAFADLAAALGHHNEAIVFLRALTQDEPLHEGLHSRLMLALADSGEQAAALKIFADIRARLADDLGVDPAAELRAAHTSVLRRQPRAETSVHSDDRSSAGSKWTATDAAYGLQHLIPAQLPADVTAFIGRASQIDDLNTLLNGQDNDRSTAVVISAIAGAAGVGKTALAVHWAHQVREQFPDGQLYVNLRGFCATGRATSPAEAMRGFLEAFAVPSQRIPTSTDAQAALYRSILSGRRVLIVLDNARDVEQVRPLLPGAPGCLVLVTSRNQLAGLVAAEGAFPVTLKLLSPPEARQLLASRIGRERVAAEPEAANEIVELCARLPVALVVMTARAATHPDFPLAALATELRQARGGLDGFAHTADPATDLRAVFSSSYHGLSADTANAFRLFSLHPGPDITVAAMANLAATSVRSAHANLSELTHAHLLNEHSPGRYNAHDLIHAYATELAHTHDPLPHRRAALHRLLDHYLHTAHAAALTLEQRPDPLALAPSQPAVLSNIIVNRADAVAWFTAERHVLLKAIDHANRAGFVTHTWQLAWALADFLDYSGHWHDWSAAQRTALEATQRAQHQPGQACSDLGRAYTRLANYDDADTHLKHALDLYRQLDDHIGQAITHSSLGWLYRRQQLSEEALHHDQQAVALYRTAGNRRWHALALNNLGWCHAKFSAYQQGLAYCEQALTLLQQIGDPFGEAAAWDSLGYAHHHLGHQKQAITCYRHAVDLFRDTDHRYHHAAALTHLGDTHHTNGHPTAARNAWDQALAILATLNHPDADQVRNKLANIET
jgi:DNA-binding SARP family transcriptional activator/tetratricopeptide (TPR) repeat protein